MTDKKIVDNSERPAQPEPGEDEAVQQPAVREDGGTPAESERAKEEERRRQTGEE
jgi:hypothetical protein